MLVGTGLEPSENMRALAAEFDIEIDTETVFDHTHYDKEHDTIATSNFVGPNTIIDTKQIQAPVLYKGTGLTVGQLPLSTSILAAESDAFISDSYNKRASTLDTVTLVGALQSRNSARATFVGSLDVFSDAFLSASANIGSDQM